MRILVAMLTSLFFLTACAEDKADSPAYIEGVHYKTLSTPVHTVDPSKVEVSEAFWYGCGHCFKFEPMLEAWSEKLPDDVVFRYSPAIWRPVMAVHAKAFYTAEALGVLDKIHQPLFDALNLEHKKLADEDSLAQFFSEHGVDEAAFRKIFNSFGVANQVRQAEARARGWGIEGTPSIIVDGKYVTSGNKAGSNEAALKVTDFLIEKARAEKQQ